MYTFSGNQQRGFITMVILSALLHLVIFIPFFYLKERTKRIFISPVYTVDLVSIPQDRPKKTRKVKKKGRISKARKKTKKKVVKPVKKKETAKKITAATPQIEKKRNIEEEKKIKDALKEVEREVRLREEDLKARKVIERIEEIEKSKDEEIRLKREFERLKHKEETERFTGLKEKVARLEKKRRIKELGLKALEGVENIREQERLREEDIRSFAVDEPSDLPIGRRLLAGRSIGEKDSKLLDIRFEDYYIKIWEKIQGAWILPASMAGESSGLETVVGIKIGRNGSVLKKRIEKGSGSAIYDESTLRAIEKSDPLPPLPPGFRGRVFEVGIRFRDSEK